MNIFAWIGTLEMTIGFGLLVAGILVSGEPRPGLLMTGGIMLLMGFIFYRVGKKVGEFRVTRPGILDTGLPGQGLVTRMWETGVTVNSSPVIGYEMDITMESRDPITASVQQVTPRMVVGAILPGTHLSVKVNQADPTDVAIDFTIAPVPATTSGGGLPSPGPGPVGDMDDTPLSGIRRDAGELLKSGRRGTARVVAARDMGTLKDLEMATSSDARADDHLFYLELEVKLPGREAYPATVANRVPVGMIGSFGPGRSVPVAVDREDERRSVAIDWDDVGA